MDIQVFLVVFFPQQRRDEHSKAKSLRIPGVDSHSRLLGRVCGCRSGFRCAGPVCFPWAACGAALWIRVSRASIRIHFLSAPLWDQSLYKASCLLNGSHRLGQQLFLICILAGKTQGSETARAPKKKRKRPQKKSRERQEKVAEPRAQTLGEKSLAASGAGKPAVVKDEKASGSTGGPTGAELWDVGQGRWGSMQTWSFLVIRKDTARHGGIVGDVPKSKLQWADHRDAVGG